MRLTIERMRLLVLAAGVLLVGALFSFIALSKLRNQLSIKELPKKLGLNIQSDSTGFTLDHSFGAHSRYRIHASKAMQYTEGKAVLRDVKIELFGVDGKSVDRIEGGEFEYDSKTGKGKATGPVEITLMRPGVAPAIAPKATPGQIAGKATPLASAAQNAARGEVRVKTSGLIFDEKTGIATTAEHVEFSTIQGTGNSIGATYDSQQGTLVLDRAVDLNALRGSTPVRIHAQHAEFVRDEQLCRMHAASADYQSGQASAGDAKVYFREDGSVTRLDAVNGFTMTTASGTHITAPSGQMEFNEQNQPHHGHLQGGVKLDSTSQSNGHSRQVHGSAPTAELEFTAKGELHHAHLERGVEMHSDEQAQAVHTSRTWRSPVADLDFRATEKSGMGKIELAQIHGTEGVIVTGESQRGATPVSPSRMAADDLIGTFGPGSQLTTLTGTGHTSIQETTSTGTRQNSTGDRLEAHFATQPAQNSKTNNANSALSSQVQSAELDGHVVLAQQPAAMPGAPPEAPLQATAERAVYEGAGEWLHLTIHPRVVNGGLELTADKLDVSRASGDAFAHGNVKASWMNQNDQPSKQQAHGASTLGGQGPAHVVAAEAQLRQITGEATFRGQARLWQQANSISAPIIVLDHLHQTLTAHSADAANPVRAVLLNAGTDRQKDGRSSPPSVIRLHGGDLKYSDTEHKAWMHGGALNTVVAETTTATSVSNEVELLLLPAGNHAGKDGASAQVDRLIARGRVNVTSQGRRGTGEQLVYSGGSGEYVLTGTASAPPRMTDPAHGTVTGEALIFHSRDDSVSVEAGSGRRTTTETTTQK